MRYSPAKFAIFNISVIWILHLFTSCSFSEQAAIAAIKDRNHVALPPAHIPNIDYEPAYPSVVTRMVVEQPFKEAGLMENEAVVKQGQKVKPRLTQWAPDGDHEAVVRGLNDILLAHGIASENVRMRMIAHAVVASGWKQNIWNYNAWGVKKGDWQGDWYIMPTVEEDEGGNEINVEDAQWRAFNSWDDAIEDFQSRIHLESERPSYRKASQYLYSELMHMSVSGGYWRALGSGNYYTATKFTGRKFAILCVNVRKRMRDDVL